MSIAKESLRVQEIERLAGKAQAPPVSLRTRWPILVLVILGVGIALRVGIWAYQKSLWLDELGLIRTIEDLSPHELLSPLGAPWQMSQSAPVGYVVVLWSAIKCFGISPLGLRVFAMLASVVTLIAAWPILRRFAGPRGSVFALAVLAVSRGILYYAGDIKQYSTELLVSTLVILAATRAHERPCWSRWGVLIAVGCVGQLFSLPVLFVLASVFAVLAWQWWGTRKAGAPHHAAALLMMACAWGGVFVANWLVLLRHYARDPIMRIFWADAYLPVPHSLQDARWYAGMFNDLYRAMFEIALPFPRLMLAVLVLIGIGSACVRLVRQRDRAMLFFLLPMVLCIVAAFLHLYPFAARLLFFGLIGWCAFAGLGFEAVCRIPWRWPRIAGVAAAVAGLALIPSWKAAPWRPAWEMPTPEALGYIASNWKPGDVVWVQPTLRPAVDFYASDSRLDPQFVQGPPLDAPHPDRMRTTMRESLTGLPRRGRVWLLTGFPKTEWPEETRVVFSILAPGRAPDHRIEFGKIELERVDFDRP